MEWNIDCACTFAIRNVLVALYYKVLVFINNTDLPIAVASQRALREHAEVIRVSFSDGNAAIADKACFPPRRGELNASKRHGCNIALERFAASLRSERRVYSRQATPLHAVARTLVRTAYIRLRRERVHFARKRYASLSSAPHRTFERSAHHADRRSLLGGLDARDNVIRGTSYPRGRVSR